MLHFAAVGIDWNLEFRLTSLTLVQRSFQFSNLRQVFAHNKSSKTSWEKSAFFYLVTN